MKKALVFFLVVVLLGGMMALPIYAAGKMVLLPLDFTWVGEIIDVPPTKKAVGWSVIPGKKGENSVFMVGFKKPLKPSTEFIAMEVNGKKGEIFYSFNREMVTAKFPNFQGGEMEVGPAGNTRKFLVTAEGKVILKK
jgi:hypothetical protein